MHTTYSYETACEEYLKALEVIQKTGSEQETAGSSASAISAITIHFVVNRVSICAAMAAVIHDDEVIIQISTYSLILTDISFEL